MMIKGLRIGWALLATWAWLPGCGLDVVEFDVVEQGQVGLAAIQFPGMGQFASSLGQALSAKDVDPGDVDSLRLLSAELVMTSQGGLTNDLSFLHDLSFTATATGQTPQVLAERAEFTTGLRRADLAVEPTRELKPYLEPGDMAVETDARLQPPPPDLVELELTFHMRVDVNL